MHSLVFGLKWNFVKIVFINRICKELIQACSAFGHNVELVCSVFQVNYNLTMGEAAMKLHAHTSDGSEKVKTRDQQIKYM